MRQKWLKNLVLTNPSWPNYFSYSHTSEHSDCLDFVTSVIASYLEGIWSKMMRLNIGPKICHFLLSNVTLTEDPKNKIMKKSGIHSSVPCRDSTLKQVLFCWVSKNIEKKLCFFEPLLYGWSIVLKDLFCYSLGSKIYLFLHFFRTTCKTKIVLKYCPYMGQNYGCQISS